MPAGSTIDLSGFSSYLDAMTVNGDGTVDVTFKNGAEYRYFHVAPAEIEKIVNTNTRDKTGQVSIGAAFHRYLRSVKQYERLK
jgi:hypothetical protein